MKEARVLHAFRFMSFNFSALMFGYLNLVIHDATFFGYHVDYFSDTVAGCQSPAFESPLM